MERNDPCSGLLLVDLSRALLAAWHTVIFSAAKCEGSIIAAAAALFIPLPQEVLFLNQKPSSWLDRKTSHCCQG